MIQIDMEMPISCNECPLRIGGKMDEICVYTGRSVWKNYKDRHINCPLREVK